METKQLSVLKDRRFLFNTTMENDYRYFFDRRFLVDVAMHATRSLSLFPSIYRSTTFRQRHKRRGVMPRLEVFSMWFEKNKDDIDSRTEYYNGVNPPSKDDYSDQDHFALCERFSTTKIEDDPTNFKGKIFICDDECFHEIYNSKKDSLYIDLPTKNSSKRKFQDYISGHTDLYEVAIQDPEKTFLPVMGPNAGLSFRGSFLAIVHRDSGDATIDDLYPHVAALSYLQQESFWCDDWSICHSARDIHDKCIQLKVGGFFHSLILDCIVFRDSKSVRMEVKWIMDENHATDTDIYICGELSVISDDRKSSLFKTPPNKAKKVSFGQPIPLLKSIVAVPYHADFKFSATLGRPFNVDEDSALYFPTVNDSVLFPNAEIDVDAVYSGFDIREDPAYYTHSPGYFYKCQKFIPGMHGYIEVTATIDVQ